MSKTFVVAFLAFVTLGCADVMRGAETVNRATTRPEVVAIAQRFPYGETALAVIGAITTVILEFKRRSEKSEKENLQIAVRTIDPFINALPAEQKTKLEAVQGPEVSMATKRAKLV